MAVRVPRWESRYSRKIFWTDLVIIILSVYGAAFIRYGLTVEELSVPVTDRIKFAADYYLLSLIISLAWMFFLHIYDTRDTKIFGTGPSEYKRVVQGTMIAFGLFAIVAFVMKMQIGRGYLLIALPAGLFLLLLSRWMWRKRLHRQRQRGLNSYKTLIVGERRKIQHVSSEIVRDKNAGFDLVAAVTEHGTPNDLLETVPVVAGYSNLITAIDTHEIEKVIVTGADTITPDQMRQIGWELESRRVGLIVAASLTDIAGPRIHTRPVSGLPLIEVEYPEFTGRKYFTKRIFDLVVSSLLIILLSPVMLIVGLAVKLTSKGPVFYSQSRIGLKGKPFPMFKFRSMVQNADDQLMSLLDAQGSADKPLHKIQDDPRITPVGRFIRKYSLDELPQLFNVVLGTMSLIGPRPQREAEVALYAHHHHRRLFVKPGITGLWQVSGRSNLDWDDAIRLDLYYVENWSMTGDLIILWKTIRTVIRPEGAY